MSTPDHGRTRQPKGRNVHESDREVEERERERERERESSEMCVGEFGTHLAFRLSAAAELRVPIAVTAKSQ